jgi:hypothetical protein
LISFEEIGETLILMQSKHALCISLLLGLLLGGCNSDEELPCDPTQNNLTVGDSTGLAYMNNGTGILLNADFHNNNRTLSIDLDNDSEPDISFTATYSSSQTGDLYDVLQIKSHTRSVSILTDRKQYTTAHYWTTNSYLNVAVANEITGDVIPSEADSGHINTAMVLIPKLLPLGTQSWDVDSLSFRDSLSVTLHRLSHTGSNPGSLMTRNTEFNALSLNTEGFYLINKKTHVETFGPGFVSNANPLDNTIY